MPARPFLSPRWLARHVLAVVGVVMCLALGWWQVGRAAAGNVLSYAYAVEWPVFAAFVVALWVKEVRAELHPPGNEEPPVPTPQPSAPGYIPFTATVPDRRTAPDGGDSDAGPDAELAAYNDYLAWLAADPDRRPDEYPKGSR